MSDEDDSKLNRLPTELLCRIFNFLELKDRGIIERVCIRWHSILTSRDCPLADVVVINLFEPDVWVDTIAKNRYTTVKGTFVNDFNGLRNVFRHISSAHTVKLWFHTEKFAKDCIDVIADILDVKCVDVYPYAKVHILPYLHSRLPHLMALNMRPHSNQFHTCGLQLPSFPDFSKLSTLILDNYGVDGDFEFPKTVTSLEFSKREQTHYRALLPKLSHLSNLEYLTLSHADMSKTDDFTLFIRTVCSSRLPKLIILTLRMCKICPLNLQGDEIQMNLKMIKFDLCYGNILTSIKEFISFNKKLSILALNVLCNRTSLDIVCNICCELRRRGIGLHLSILQNYPLSKAFESPFVDLKPPISLFYVLSKFEASFVEDVVLFQIILLSGTFDVLRECKFVECEAVTSDLLQHLSVSAPLLRKLGVLSCTNPKDTDVLTFISSMSTRRSPHLQITWRRDRRIGSLAACYLSLVHEHRELIKGKKARFFAKTFSEGEEGEEILIWERDSTKSIQIRDYNDHQKYRTLGFIVGSKEPYNDETVSAVS
ncbi:F-box domain protein [Dictyocaulus viviparus]|uniref:F-box domain protein n=1 Tax=Dictyocaulus viviparus TaxID=29172 RepID=A0A0D8X9V8_DICVI|nr:F-box domain protein [Dictyocaulus viviparus]